MNTTTDDRPASTTPPQTPPGPSRRWWGLPLLRAMRRDYLGFTSGLQRQYGDVTFMRLGNERAIDLFDPELVRRLLVDHAPHLVRWERGMDIFEQVFGQSVLVTEGAVWQRQRRMLQPAFSPRRVAGYAALMLDAARSALDAAVPAGEQEALVSMDTLFSQLAMDVILRTLFSTRADGDVNAAAEATQTLSATAMREMFWPVTLPDWLPLPGKAAKRRALHSLRELVGRHIRARRAAGAEGPRDDLLAMLLGLRDEATGEALSQAEVFDQCMVSFQAGHETSATALLWWSRLLAEHPQAAARAQAEVDAVLGQRAPGPDDLSSLPWLTATLKEAMRLYPPIAALMTRRTTQDIELGGWSIRRGTMLRITPWVLQRDPRVYDRPGDFVPERFLPDAVPALPRGAWMPFGTGPRVCIGQHFAMLEMTLVAALLLQRYSLVLPAGSPPPKPVLNVTLRPQGGVHLRLVRRGAAAAARSR
ncbi:cytochrome P450 [Methylibium rhizosphaerae]|uniref:cytochrome P450 n=1 Tax=Methylibium rhizosphaerae TaxID=2570323 RepID=UPI00112E423A|nr:cytochrome P450 [Methylibium rhizosphaerae]